MLLAVALQRELEDVVFVVFVGENVRRRGRGRVEGGRWGFCRCNARTDVRFCSVYYLSKERKRDERNTKN